MVTTEEAREIMLSMPEAAEGEHMNHPDFRVRNKIFATLWPDESKAVVFLPTEDHGDLLDEQPGAFSTNGWSKKHGALNVHLDHISADQFGSLVRQSWTGTAPQALVDEHSARS